MSRLSEAFIAIGTIAAAVQLLWRGVLLHLSALVVYSGGTTAVRTIHAAIATYG